MPNVQTMPDGKHIVDTGLPQKYIKTLWLEMHTDLNKKVMDAIPHAPKTTIIRMMKYHISLILDMDERKAIREKIEKLKKERLVESMTTDEKIEVIEDIYIEATEGITDYVDMAFGVSHRIAIGID